MKKKRDLKLILNKQVISLLNVDARRNVFGGNNTTINPTIHDKSEATDCQSTLYPTCNTSRTDNDSCLCTDPQ